MNGRNKQIPIQEVIRILELPNNTFDFLQERLSYNEMVNKVNELKDIVSKQKKLLSKKYHPDVFKGGHEKMAEINNIIDLLNKLKVIEQRPQVQRIHITYNYNSATSTGGTYSSTTYTSDW